MICGLPGRMSTPMERLHGRGDSRPSQTCQGVRHREDPELQDHGQASCRDRGERGDERSHLFRQQAGRGGIRLSGGTAVEDAPNHFMSHPLGLLAGDEIFVRSPQQIKDGKMVFYCNVLEGTELALLTSTDIVADTRAAVKAKNGNEGPIPASSTSTASFGPWSWRRTTLQTHMERFYRSSDDRLQHLRRGIPWPH